MDRGRQYCAVVVIMLLAALSSCERQDTGADRQATGRLRIIVTLFPLYDFAQNIAGDRADVSLLLQPGIEPHSFDPKPADIARLNAADVFIYTNRIMEPWAEDILKSVSEKRLAVVDAGAGINFAGHETARESHGRHDAGIDKDPHIWLDFGNAGKMVSTIAGTLAARDPENRSLYLQNAAAYRNRLEELDRKYRSLLSGCRKRTFIHGGHFTFGYLARRYGLEYTAAQGFSPDAEPSARSLAGLSRKLKESGLKHIFYEELLSPSLAETIAAESGSGLLKLHGGHNITRDEFAAGVSFIGLMESNLDQLMTGLQCRQ